MIKNVLRKEMRGKRQALPRNLYADKSQKIAHTLLELREYKDAKSVLFYVSTPEEVDTHFPIQEALKQGKNVFAPKVKNENLWICPVNQFEDLKPGTFGILEPCEPTKPKHPEEIDLIIVPGLAFDEHGHRIGYGKGHYDRLLKVVKGFKVGLAFQEQMIEKVPNEEHDVPLNLLITDQNTFTFPHP